MADGKLSPKQQCFVAEYLVDLNATQAAIRAGYSPKTAKEQATRLLSKAHIRDAVAVAMAERSRRTGINQDRIVQELAKIALVKMTDVVDADGRIREDATDEDLSCIESIKYKRSDSDMGSSEEREVKIASKLKALELLGRHFGMFETHVSRGQLELNREKFEYEKEKDAGAFQEYEDMDDIEQDIYGE